MTERFECDKGSRIIIDTETKLHYIMTLDWECSLVTKLLNRFEDENKQLKQQLKLKEAEERINCRNCIYFISESSSDNCLKREDIGYKGTCIDGMDYHYLAKNCPYY